MITLESMSVSYQGYRAVARRAPRSDLSLLCEIPLSYLDSEGRCIYLSPTVYPHIYHRLIYSGHMSRYRGGWGSVLMAGHVPEGYVARYFDLCIIRYESDWWLTTALEFESLLRIYQDDL
jgi:hypothetical protein